MSHRKLAGTSESVHDTESKAESESQNTGFLSSTPIKPVSIEAKNISITLKKRDKKIKRKKSDIEVNQPEKILLDDISFQIPSGKVFAIMGGSGSGKTTLLNKLAHRSSKSNSNFSQSGEVLYNGDTDINTVNHAYVIQQDILIPTLTCYETLKYAASLRLSKNFSEKEQADLIDQIINELGLKDARDTMVGSKEHKGLSGGEKRRLSIAIQLLLNPSILFLDEPTTGLDAHAAFLLIKTLKNLAEKGNRTFILSVHQPRSDIFFLFDYLCVLSRGCPIYIGETEKVVGYFANLGYEVPLNVNPADYLIDITSVDSKDAESEKQSLQRFNFFKAKWKEREQIRQEEVTDLITGEKQKRFSQRFSKRFSIQNTQKRHLNSRANLFQEVKTLIHRDLLLSSRDPLTTISLYSESIFLGLVLGLVFDRPDNSFAGIRSKSASLYNVNALQSYMMSIFEIYRLCTYDIKIFDREHGENSVSASGFVIARRISKLLTEDIMIPTLFSAISYFLLNLQPHANNFFRFWGINLLVHQVIMAFSLLAVSITRDYPIASLIGNLNFVLQTFASGFFVNIPRMPVYVRWLRYVCFIWFTYGFCVSNEFSHFFGDCPYGNETNVECTAYKGSNIIKNLGFWEDWYTLPAFIALAYGVLFNVLTCVILEYRKFDVAIAKQKKSKVEPESLKSASGSTISHQAVTTGKIELEPVDITLENISLTVKVINISIKSFLKRFVNLDNRIETSEKQILDKVTAVFQRNKVNAIMGPSGSGKTSLLTFISGRLKSSVSSEYTHSGSIFFNEQLMEPELLKNICSYVLQDDDSLLPTLTVRETFMFAAKLRVRDKSIKIEQKVDELILKLGLKECQNNMIGSEMIKGISGGEKRRVSIGIQLLNDPQVIFLDEPTSGLDSFTASSILNILENLAVNEHKTVILTIHQPRYSLFKRFGQVLLLGKNGRVVFNGSPRYLKTYFENLDYHCPKLTNLADYVLDLVSINTQSIRLEQQTKDRAEFLIHNWKQKSDTELKLDFSSFDHDVIKTRQKFAIYQRVPRNFTAAFPLILHRQFLTLFRHMDVVFARSIQGAGTGMISALFYSPLKKDYIGITNLLGLTQHVTNLYFVGVLNNVAYYPIERDFFYEEFDDKVYNLTTFLVSYTLLEVPFEFLCACIFSAFVVMVIGLPRTPVVYFTFVYSGTIVANCGESLGIIFNSFIKHDGFALNVLSLFACVAVIMSGLLSLSMPAFFKGINWISPIHFTVMLCINIVMDNEHKFTCSPESGSLGNGKCIFNNGSDVLSGYHIRVNKKLFFGFSAMLAVLYRLFAWLVLYVKLNRLGRKLMRRVLLGVKSSEKES